MPQQSRLDMSLTAPEYGLGYTVPVNMRPATVGYYLTFDYTYNIAGATTGNTVLDTFARTVANDWGTDDTGQAWTIFGGAVTDYNVTPGQGQIVMNTTAGRIVTLQTPLLANANVVAKVTPAVTATGGILAQAVTARADATGANEYDAFLLFNTDGTVDLSLQKRVASVTTTLATLTGIGTYAPGTGWFVRLDVNGSNISARGWAATSTEPGAYQVSVVDTSLTSGRVGVRAFRAAGNTNVAPPLNWNRFQVGNVFTDSIRGLYFAPQRFGEYWMVDRVSVNDTSQGQVPGVFIMRGLVRPDTAFDLTTVTYPHQVPALLATSNLVDSTPNGTNDVDNLENPINLSPGEYFTVLFAASQFPAPNTIQTSTVFVGGTVIR